MTLMEVMVACGVLGMAFLATAFIQVSTAKQIRALYGDARTLHRAQLVLDRIRYKLAMGQAGSPVVKDDGHTLEFTNPLLGGVVSMFKFVDGRVYYYTDKTASPSAPGRGIGQVNDCRFEVLGAGNAVRVTITTLEHFTWRIDRPFSISMEVTLLN